MNEQKPPAIVLYWNPETQAVQVTINPGEVKNSTFAEALLEMARSTVEQQRRMQAVAHMQQQAQEESAVRKLLRN